MIDNMQDAMRGVIRGHSRFIAIAGVVEIPAIVEWIWSQPQSLAVGIATCLYVILVAGISLFPRCSSILLIAYGILYSISTYAQLGPSPIWGTMAALAIIAYMMKMRYAVLCFAMTVLCQIVVVFYIPDSGSDPRSIFSFFWIFGVVLLLGKSLSWRDGREEAKQAKAIALLRESQLKREQRTALEMHDGISGSLSLATRELQRYMRKNVLNDEEKEAIERANGYIVEGLQGTHRAVRYLREEPANGICGDLVGSVRSLLASEDRKLSLLHYRGKGTCAGNNVLVSKETRDELLSLLRECYANICRHAPQHARYRITVRLSVEGIQIHAENHVAQGDAPDELRGGNGLGLHRRRLRQLGGSLTCSSSYGIWVTMAWLPISQ